MEAIDTLREILPLLIPIILIELALIVAALLDLSKRSELNGPRWMWILVILFVNLFGPILYFVLGRKES